MSERRSLPPRWLRPLVLLAFLLALAPLTVTAGRKVRSFARADVFVSVDANGYRVRHVGDSARPTKLEVEDLLLTIDGKDALRTTDIGGLLANRSADVTLVRRGELRRVETAPAPTPWEVRFRYLFLLAVGGAFFVSGLYGLRQSTLFSGFALAVSLVLVLTPAPPLDGFFRLSILLEDVARALFPALLLRLVFTFPRRARKVPALAFFLPALALLALTAHVYLAPGAPESDARLAVGRLDRAQAAWMAVAALVAVVRLVVLSRRAIDLLTEKQIRFLLFGTAAGLLPICLLDLVPHLFGGTIPILSSLSLLPLVLVPLAFLAALTRYRLWDVEVLGRETAALLGAVLVGAGFFTAAQILLAKPIAIDVPYARGILQSAAGLLLALSFVPVRRGLSAALARLQYRSVWTERENLLSLVRDLPAPRRLREIESLLVSRLSSGLGVAPAALLVVSENGSAAADGVDGGEPLLLDELPPAARERPTRLSRGSFSERPTPSVARLRRAGFRTVAPLAVSGRVLALFAVGDRAGRVPLSHEDLQLLETVLAPAALALDHARLYGELEAQADRYKTLKEFHEDVVSGSAAAIAATDETGRFTSANPAFARLTGRTEAALLAATDREVLPQALLDGPPPARLEADLGSGVRVLDVAVSPFPGAAAGSRARVYVLQDATETSRLERALVDHERLAALGTLSAGVAHEVNTPLTGVAGFARLLLEETPEGDPRRGLVEKIERQAFRASRLVGSLLDMARGRPRDLVPLDPGTIVREAARALEDETAARGVALSLDVPHRVSRVRGHGDALIQVLVNLLKNGMEAAAGAPEPAVSLSVREIGGEVLFEVDDNGPGMSPAESARIFEPFYSTKTAQGGTGLGLAIAGDIIRAHGGSLKVASTPGTGSRFTVALPAAAI